jgi:hypothetical protein
MWTLRCCFFGGENTKSAHKTSEGSAVGSSGSDAPLQNDKSPISRTSSEPLFVSLSQTKGGSFAVNQPDAADAFRPSPNGGVTVAVDVTSPVETPCLPARWSDWGCRPELEAILPSPFVSTNHGSFSRLLQKPESLDLDSTASFGGYNSCVLGAACASAGRQPPVWDLRSCTIAQLLGAVSSTSWVGQGAQGAVIKGLFGRLGGRHASAVPVRHVLNSAALARGFSSYFQDSSCIV